jgi:hypothetical protein
VWRDEIKAAGEKTGRVDFFLSATTVPADQRLTTFEPVWEFLGAWAYPENPSVSMPSRPHYQGISFVWDRGTGQLFLIGTRNTTVTAPNDAGEDMADLFGVLPPAAGSRTPALDHVTSIRFKGADQFCNFAGGGGAFVSEAGALALYGAFHFRGDGIFRLSEFWSDLAEGPTWWVDLFERSDFTGHRFSVFGPEEGASRNTGSGLRRAPPSTIRSSRRGSVCRPGPPTGCSATRGVRILPGRMPALTSWEPGVSRRFPGSR